MAEIYIDQSIVKVRRLYASVFKSTAPPLVLVEQLTELSHGIHSAFQQGDDAVLFHLGCWCPTLAGKSPSQIMQATLTIDDVYAAIAREYGFANWQTIKHLGDQTLNADFEETVELVIHGEVATLNDRLKANPKLTVERSCYGHRSTLLHYVGANGVESHRQITPMNCVDVVQCLIDHGAEVNAHADMYGGGSTALMLVLSSAHPANAGVADDVAAVLRYAGAL